ncbi:MULTISPECIES: hypothetical protein [Rhizobium]|uniref:hypothetical protein n=1 Tax=Rhizobium TaxID=379 RepID=UPI001FD91D78|nr:MULTISPECIES: hypothetical protein [Rhizobium]
MYQLHQMSRNSASDITTGQTFSYEAEPLQATSSPAGLHKEHDGMERNKKSDKYLADSRLRAATVDHRQKDSASKKKTLFQQLLLDWAYGCDLFYPIQRHEHFAKSEEDDKGAKIRR